MMGFREKKRQNTHQSAVSIPVFGTGTYDVNFLPYFDN
jgi:hypothetical protein